MSTDPLRDVVHSQCADALKAAYFILHGSMNVIEIRCSREFAADSLKPPFHLFEKCSWDSSLMRMALTARQLAQRRFAYRFGWIALTFKETHFTPRVVPAVADIVTHYFVEGHARSCRLGRSPAQIWSSWNVVIPWSVFFQKYSACSVAALFHAFTIVSTAG
jgi:hypothetical protein